MSSSIVGIVAGFWVSVFAGMSLAYGPSLEPRIFPVVVDSEFQVIQRNEKVGSVTGTLSFEKVRNCTYIGIAFYGVGEDGLDRRLNFTFLDLASGNQSRPIGAQRSNAIQVDDVLGKHEEIYAVVSHSCHFLWDIQTPMGPWPVK